MRTCPASWLDHTGLRWPGRQCHPQPAPTWRKMRASCLAQRVARSSCCLDELRKTGGWLDASAGSGRVQSCAIVRWQSSNERTVVRSMRRILCRATSGSSMRNMPLQALKVKAPRSLATATPPAASIVSGVAGNLQACSRPLRCILCDTQLHGGYAVLAWPVTHTHTVMAPDACWPAAMSLDSELAHLGSCA